MQIYFANLLGLTISTGQKEWPQGNTSSPEIHYEKLVLFLSRNEILSKIMDDVKKEELQMEVEEIFNHLKSKRKEEETVKRKVQKFLS